MLDEPLIVARVDGVRDPHETPVNDPSAGQDDEPEESLGRLTVLIARRSRRAGPDTMDRPPTVYLSLSTEPPAKIPQIVRC